MRGKPKRVQINGKEYPTITAAAHDIGCSVSGLAAKIRKQNREENTAPLTADDYARFWEKANTCDGDACWEWQAACFKNGYGAFRKPDRNRLAHRVAWEITNGEIPAGMYVLHTCDNRKCVNPSHLWIGTPQDNVLDMIAKGRNKNPKSTGKPKLSWSKAKKIRALFATGDYSRRALSDMFGVSHSAITCVIEHRTWIEDER